MRFLSAIFFGGISFSRMIPASENVLSLQRFGLDSPCLLLLVVAVFFSQIKLSVANVVRVVKAWFHKLFGLTLLFSFQK